VVKEKKVETLESLRRWLDLKFLGIEESIKAIKDAHELLKKEVLEHWEATILTRIDDLKESYNILRTHVVIPLTEEIKEVRKAFEEIEKGNISRLNEVKKDFSSCRDASSSWKGDFSEKFNKALLEKNGKIETIKNDLTKQIDELTVTFLNKIPRRTMNFVIMAIVISAFVGSLVTIVTDTPIWKHLLQKIGIAVGG